MNRWRNIVAISFVSSGEVVVVDHVLVSFSLEKLFCFGGTLWLCALRGGLSSSREYSGQTTIRNSKIGRLARLKTLPSKSNEHIRFEIRFDFKGESSRKNQTTESKLGRQTQGDHLLPIQELDQIDLYQEEVHILYKQKS